MVRTSSYSTKGWGALGKARALLVVRLAAVAQAVQALRCGLAVGAGDHLRQAPCELGHLLDVSQHFLRRCVFVQDLVLPSRAWHKLGLPSRAWHKLKQTHGAELAGDPVAGRACRPASTLMPGTIPALLSTSTKGLPAAVDWYSVSSNMMHPEMASLRPGAV